jgi:hypothetical protein
LAAWAASSKRERETTRYAALGLLLVLLSGLSITTCTHNWFNSLPYHDHIILGARAMGLVHHSHNGDQLSHWMNGVQMVGVAMPDDAASSASPSSPAGGGIVSLKSLNGLQPEINSYTATGLFALVALIAFAARGVLLHREGLFLPAGQFPAPPLPPPRLV